MRINSNNNFNKSYIKTYDDYVNFSGYTLPNTKIHTSSPAHFITSNEYGFFCINQYIESKTKKFSITFQKTNFKQTRYTYYLKHLTRKIKLKIYSDNITYYDSNALIEGVTDTDVKIDVYGVSLNSEPVVDEYGNFEFYANLNDGNNKFTIVAQKENYAPAIKTVNVNYDTN
jgi:hypothetical protein